jgi:hypothetical protein
MSYTTRFINTFQDLYGTPYKVEIKEKDYTGAPTSVILSAGGFRLTYSGNNRGSGSLVMGSKVEMELKITSDGEKEFIKDIAINGSKHFLCNISRDSDGSGYTQFWTGFVLADLNSFDDAPYPFNFKVVASDGFGVGAELDYTNSVWEAAGAPADTYRTHTELLIECLEIIGISQQMDSAYPLLVAETLLVEQNQLDFPQQSKLEVTRVNTKTFAQYDTTAEGVDYEYKSAYQVIEEVCKVWNARILQYDGQFYFIPVANYLAASANFHQVNSSGISANTVLNVDLFANGSEVNRMAGGMFDFYPPVKKSCVEYKYNYDPVAGVNGVEDTECGVNNTQAVYKLFEGFPLGNYESYADAGLAISIDYEYQTKYMSDDMVEYPEPVPNAVIVNLNVANGDFKLINYVDGVSSAGLPSFTTAEWKRNYEHTFSGFSTGQASMNIGVMACYGLPADEGDLVLFVDGEKIGKNYYVYNQSAQTITFSDVGGSVDIFADSVATVIFDYIGSGSYKVHLPNMDTDSTTLIASTSPMIIDVPSPPEKGSIDISPYGDNWSVMTVYNTGLNAIDYGATTPIKADDFIIEGTVPASAQWVRLKKFLISNFDATVDYSAQPTNSTASTKLCSIGTTDSDVNITTTMMTGDKSEFVSDSNLQVQTASGWENSAQWDLDIEGLSLSGNLITCINAANLHMKSVPNVKYNGALQRVGSTFFNPVIGLEVPTFNATPDKLFFGGGTLVAADAIWDVQLVQLG